MSLRMVLPPATTEFSACLSLWLVQLRLRQTIPAIPWKWQISSLHMSLPFASRWMLGRFQHLVVLGFVNAFFNRLRFDFIVMRQLRFNLLSM